MRVCIHLGSLSSVARLLGCPTGRAEGARNAGGVKAEKGEKEQTVRMERAESWRE